MILAAIMMLHRLAENKAATSIQSALESVLTKSECLTPDLGGFATTTKFAEAIIKEIER